MSIARLSQVVYSRHISEESKIFGFAHQMLLTSVLLTKFCSPKTFIVSSRDLTDKNTVIPCIMQYPWMYASNARSSEAVRVTTASTARGYAKLQLSRGWMETAFQAWSGR